MLEERRDREHEDAEAEARVRALVNRVAQIGAVGRSSGRAEPSPAPRRSHAPGRTCVSSLWVRRRAAAPSGVWGPSPLPRTWRVIARPIPDCCLMALMRTDGFAVAA